MSRVDLDGSARRGTRIHVGPPVGAHLIGQAQGPAPTLYASGLQHSRNVQGDSPEGWIFR